MKPIQRKVLDIEDLTDEIYELVRIRDLEGEEIECLNEDLNIVNTILKEIIIALRKKF